MVRFKRNNSSIKLYRKKSALNHTFLPNGGGADLLGCSDSYESNCIELHLAGLPVILKQKELTFQWFEDANYEWTYFMLDTDELEPSGIYNEITNRKKQLLEIKSNSTDLREYIEYTEDEDIRKKDVRGIIRYMSGRFAIFSTGSAYNLRYNSYDGKHDELTSQQFKSQISQIVKKLR